MAGSGGRSVAAVIGFGLILTVGFGLIGIPRGVTYATGERVTAAVEDCQTTASYGRRSRNRTSTTCVGRWITRDGREHHGQIDGAGEEHEGRRVLVRASGEDAQVDGVSLLWPVGAFLLSLAAVAGGCAVALSRRRVRSAAGTPGRGGVLGPWGPGWGWRSAGAERPPGTPPVPAPPPEYPPAGPSGYQQPGRPGRL